MLELKTSTTENILDIELRGSLDSQSASDFKAWVLEKNVQGYNMFALNCRELEFISSRGISALIEINKLLRARKSHLALYHLSEEALNLLKFLKITDEIAIKETLKEIIETFANLAAVPEPKEPLGQEKKAPEEDDKEEVEESELWNTTLPDEQQETTQGPAQNQDQETEEIIDLQTVDDEFSTIEEKAEPLTPENKTEELLDKTASAEPTPKHEISQEQPEELPLESKDEYIDLSQTEDFKNSFLEEEKIIECPNCSEPLRVNQNGQYLCPECRTKFHYPVIN